MNTSPKKVIALLFYAVILLVVIWLAVGNNDRHKYSDLLTKPTPAKQTESNKACQTPVTPRNQVLEEY